MTATIHQGRLGPEVVARLSDWHAAGRFLHVPAQADADPSLTLVGCINDEEAERLARYVNDQVKAKARLREAMKTADPANLVRLHTPVRPHLVRCGEWTT